MELSPISFRLAAAALLKKIGYICNIKRHIAVEITKSCASLSGPMLFTGMLHWSLWLRLSNHSDHPKKQSAQFGCPPHTQAANPAPELIALEQSDACAHL